MHPSRRARLNDLRSLDPDSDFEEIYRRTMLWEFPKEARLAFQLAFYRPMASPRIARILVETGHFLRNTTKRSYDSGIVIHEIIAGGIDSDRGRRMIALMNRLHDRPDIEQQDLTYVLLGLLLEPIDLIKKFGWRALDPKEVRASVRFYMELGRRMGISEIPESYEAAVAWYARYERDHTSPSPESKRLTGAIVKALAELMPRQIQPNTGEIMSTLLGNEAAAAALGLPKPRTILKLTTLAVMKARRYVERWTPAPTKASFDPGGSVRNTYPTGYRLEDIGPENS